jgi:hypothetical protein
VGRGRPLVSLPVPHQGKDHVLAVARGHLDRNVLAMGRALEPKAAERAATHFAICPKPTEIDSPGPGRGRSTQASTARCWRRRRRTSTEATLSS